MAFRKSSCQVLSFTNIWLERAETMTSAQCLQDSRRPVYKQGASPAAARVHSIDCKLARRRLASKGDSRISTESWLVCTSWEFRGSSQTCTPSFVLFGLSSHLYQHRGGEPSESNFPLCPCLDLCAPAVDNAHPPIKVSNLLSIWANRESEAQRIIEHSALIFVERLLVPLTF